jgi:acetolactate decarboxylase
MSADGLAMTHIADWVTTSASILRREQPRRPTTLYQTSLMSALLAGVYDGETTVGELLTHGDFGLGTFDHLDGELVIVDGSAYHLHSDGTATTASTDEVTPFAAVIPFEADITFPLDGICTRKQLVGEIERHLPSANLMYGIRIDALFRSVTSRTVKEQHRPYPPFTEVANDEVIATAAPTIGTIAGFRMPSFEEGISVAGYHLHYVSNDREVGGHNLDFTAAEGTVSVCVISDMHLQLPRTAPFLTADLDQADQKRQIEQAEGGSTGDPR